MGGQVHQVAHVPQQGGVVHGGQFKVRAVRQKLLLDLAIQNVQSQRLPAFSMSAFQEGAGKHERLAVHKQVVCQDVIFHLFGQGMGLHGQAVQPMAFQARLSLQPLHQVHDTQRERIGFPSATAEGRVIHNPAVDQAGVECSGCLVGCCQMVEVMQVVLPDFRECRVAPLDGRFHAHEVELLVRRKTGRTPARGFCQIKGRSLAESGCRKWFYFGETVIDPVENLLQP
ncbi:hypothetical protein D3C84_435970 [compost metagenome]